MQILTKDGEDINDPASANSEDTDNVGVDEITDSNTPLQQKSTQLETKGE